MDTILKFLNDNHWYLVAIVIIAGLLFWTFGCESQVSSLLDPNQKITRAELQVELDYIIGQARVKTADLDRQDAYKQFLLDQAAVFATTGTLNPTGLMNTAISVFAIAFGLDRNKKLKEALKSKNP